MAIEIMIIDKIEETIMKKTLWVTPMLAKDTGWIVANVSNIDIVHLLIITGSRFLFKDHTIIVHS